MAAFSFLGDKPTVPDILKISPHAGKALLEMHEAIMRGPSALSPGDRELIAACVSRANGCQYCYGVHAATARAYGWSAAAVESMLEDDAGGGPHKLAPILRYARKLTAAPNTMTDADADAVYAVGWGEKALHDAILVVCCFNFMNRLLDAHGAKGHQALYEERGPLLKEHGYLPLIRLLPLDANPA
ncbi:MAG: peroxidase-related enzyme [Alphaproteobacteria bacterium]|nr:peroxidase-related enzyme [Alphaproteobacteria bacterium]